MAGFDLTIEGPAASRRTVQEVVLFLLVIVLSVLAAAPAYAAPSGFTFCAGEGEACDLRTLTGYVTFGAGEGSCDLTAGTCTGTYTRLSAVAPENVFYTTCRLELFAGPDPAPGVAKSCFYIASGAGGSSAGGASSPASALDPPSTEELQSFFMFGIAGVLGSYLVAWGCARLLEQISDKKS